MTVASAVHSPTLPDLLLQFTILDALSRIAAPVPLSELLPYKDEKLLRKALIDCLGKAEMPLLSLNSSVH